MLRFTLLFLTYFLSSTVLADHVAIVFLTVDKNILGTVKASVLAGKKNLVTFSLPGGNVTSRQVTAPGMLPIYTKVVQANKKIFYSNSCYNNQTIIELNFPKDFADKKPKC